MGRRRRAGFVPVGAALFGLTVAGQAHADAPAAQALFDQAKQAMEAHKYAEACTKFEDSYKLQAALGTLLNLAACYEADGRLATAWTTFLEVASKARAAGQAGRATLARERAAALAPKLSNLAIDVPNESRVPGLEIRRDGDLLGSAEWGTPLPIDAGEHTVQASAPDHKPWTKTVSVAGGAATVRLSVPVLEAAQPVETSGPIATTHTTGPEALAPSLPPKDAAVHEGRGIGRPLGVVLGGVGVAGIAVGGVFGWLTKGAVDRRNQECSSPQCGDANYRAAVRDHDQAVQYGLISEVGFIAGGALVAGGAALFFLSGPVARSSTDASSSVVVVPAAGPSGGSLSLQGTF
ncbi:MAG: hypothetical protein JOZ69_00625 [Myxococcales bacterium]|nr:hypothetical protein [Myxococcales bacterium]